MIPRDFDKVSFDQALEALGTKKRTRLGEDARLFFEGDHWASGRFWVGPRLDGVTSDAALLLKNIAIEFCAKNVVKEVIERHAAGVMGREPDWGLSPNRPKLRRKKQRPALPQKKDHPAPEQPLIDEAEAALTEWWDDRSLLDAFQKLARQVLLEGTGVMRAFVPSGLAGQSVSPGLSLVPVGPLGTSLERIYVEVPEPGSAAVYEDKGTRRKLGVFSYKEQLDDGTEEERVEVSFVDEQGRTVIRILSRGGIISETRQHLGGRLSVLAVEDEPLITETLLENQKNLNRSLTMMGRNSDVAGFTERTFLNVQLQGRWVDAEGYPDNKKFIPDPISLGPGITNNFVGTATVDPSTGKSSVADPNVLYRDPTDPETFLKTQAGHYRNILEEVDQIHALISGDSTATGESRKQAREGFVKRLLKTKTKLDRIGRQLLEVVLAMASVFSGRAGQFAALRAVFECTIDAGSQSLDEQRQTVEAFSAGILSKETAMQRSGIEDPAAELESIAAEREAEIGAGMQRAESDAEGEEAAVPQPAPEPEAEDAA